MGGVALGEILEVAPILQFILMNSPPNIIRQVAKKNSLKSNSLLAHGSTFPVTSGWIQNPIMVYMPTAHW